MIGHLLSHALSNQNCCSYCTADFWLRLREVRQRKDVLAEISLPKCTPIPSLKSTNYRESTVPMPTWTIHAIIPPHRDSPPHTYSFSPCFISVSLHYLNSSGKVCRWARLCGNTESYVHSRLPRLPTRQENELRGQRPQWGGGVDNDKVDLNCWGTFSELVLCKDTCEIKAC